MATQFRHSDLLSDLGRSDLLLLLEFVDRCSRAVTRSDVEALLLDLCRHLPTRGVVACLFPSISRVNAADAVTIVNAGFPEEWAREYVRNDYFSCDPTKASLKSGAHLPSWYDTFVTAKEDSEKRYIRRHREFEIGDGVTSTARQPRAGKWSYFAFRGEALTQSGRDQAVLSYVTPYLHEMMRRATGVDPSPLAMPPGELSERELEVLSWVMMGKTNWEISCILSISERTVKFHIHRSMSKLDASSRSHAVAIALAEGLIR